MIDNLFTKHNEINQNKTEMKLNHFGSIRLLKKIGCFLSDTTYEVGVKDNLFNVNKLNLGIGGYLGYYGYSSTKVQFGGSSTTSYNILSPGIRVLAHYQVIEKLDAYVGPSIGFSVQHGATEASGMETKTENKILFAWGFIGGLRYEITPQWGAFIEGGKASGSFTLGAAYKF